VTVPLPNRRAQLRLLLVAISGAGEGCRVSVGQRSLDSRVLLAHEQCDDL
jgi:hypothetical protein